MRESGAPRVLVCGSCRVGKPLLRATSNVVDVAHFLAFSHNPPEALQQLRQLRADSPQPPDYMRALLTMRTKWIEFADTTADVAVLEVCARKTHTLDAWLMPRRSVERMDRAGLEYEAHELTDAEIRAGVAEFAAYLAPVPVLVVSHFSVDFPGVGRLASRDSLVAVVEGLDNVATFNPSAEVEAWGVADAITDPAHYSDRFEAHLGAVLLKRCKAIISDDTIDPR